LFKKILAEFKTNDVEGLHKETEQFVEYLKGLDNGSDFVPGLIDTVDRQVLTMLIKKKYVEKWGEHQLRHLIKSLEMQCKGNFREQMLKDFGGQMFNDLADAADDIYNNMEPPVPSRKPITQTAAQIQSAQDFAAKMNNFDDNQSDGSYGYYGGGCFAGHNTVQMADGTTKFVKDLVKGDQIASLDGETATIRCVVRTATFQGQTDMCELDGGLLITPGHPVRLQGNWVYPRDVVQRKVVDCEAFYNLVVDQGHTAVVNGIELILLGHDYTEGILKHEYLGTQRVINDLKQLPGFTQGLVHLEQDASGDIKRPDSKMTKRATNQAEAEKLTVA